MKMTTGIMALVAIATAGMHAAYAQGDEALQQRLSDLEGKVSQLEEHAAKSLRGNWRNGFIFEDPDKSFRLQLGARFQLDAAFFSPDDALEEASGPFDDGVKFRRVYLFARGHIYDNLLYVMEYNFASGVGFQNMYMGVSDVPVLGTVLAGQILEPMGLEENSSNNSITFMERGYSSVFNPIYNTGIMAHNTALDQRVRWAAGIFKDTDNLGASVSNEEFAVTARLTGLPYIHDDGRKYLHLGYSISHRSMNEAGYRLRGRPDSFIAPYVADTKAIPSDRVNLVGLETALSLGSLFLQAEWSMASVDRLDDENGASLGDADFQGYYVMASYFLTGEHRPYSKASGIIGRLSPKQNATGKNWGSGAWEVAARYNVLDLNDDGVEGGKVESVTLGLNWYLNPHTRVMWNYVMADVEDTGDVDIFQMRFQFDF